MNWEDGCEGWVQVALLGRGPRQVFLWVREFLLPGLGLVYFGGGLVGCGWQQGGGSAMVGGLWFGLLIGYLLNVPMTGWLWVIIHRFFGRLSGIYASLVVWGNWGDWAGMVGMVLYFLLFVLPLLGFVVLPRGASSLQHRTMWSPIQQFFLALVWFFGLYRVMGSFVSFVPLPTFGLLLVVLTLVDHRQLTGGTPLSRGIWGSRVVSSFRGHFWSTWLAVPLYFRSRHWVFWGILSYFIFWEVWEGRDRHFWEGFWEFLWGLGTH